MADYLIRELPEGERPRERLLKQGELLVCALRGRELRRAGLEHDAHVEQVQGCLPTRSPAAGVPDDSLEPGPLVHRRDPVTAAGDRDDDALRLPASRGATEVDFFPNLSLHKALQNDRAGLAGRGAACFGTRDRRRR